MRAHTFVLLAIAVLFGIANSWSDSAVYKTVLPTVKPTTTRDPWECVIANLTQYFDVPKPTGSLFQALSSYATGFFQSCSLTASQIDRMNGACFPAKEKLCGFTTVAPASVLPDYESYGSAASSWWAAHSSKAVRFAIECPNGWYEAMFSVPGGPGWLNNTIIHAACRADAAEVITTTTSSYSAGSSSTTTSTTATAATLPGVPSAPTASVTPAPNGGSANYGEDLEMWMIAGTGVVAAAANSMWNGI